MLSPKEFIDLWGKDDGDVIQFPKKSLARLSIPEVDKIFLSEAGLPNAAAPFLSFETPDSGELPSVVTQWDLGKAFAAYRVIGSDGSGNPIALDQNTNGEVVLLDHENEFAIVFVNKSIPQLAESLLAYRQLVKDTQKEFGEDAFLDGKTSAVSREALRSELIKIDPAAMEEGGFWHNEIQNLEANAG